MVWLVFNSTVQEYPIQLCHIPEYEGRWENEVMTCSIFFFLQKKSERITTCWENNKCMHKEIHALQYSWPAVMDFAPPKCLEFPAHQWWRPATEIPVGEHKNPLPFLHIKFRPWGKKDGEKQLHSAVNKGSVSIKTLSVGERKNPTHWLKKQRETYGLMYLTCSG